MLEQGWSLLAGAAAERPAGVGHRGRRAGARRRSTCSPTAAGPSAAWRRGTARPGSSAPTAARSSAWWTAWACGRCAGARTSAAGCTSASESGVFGLDPTTIVASGQLQPGQMIALDTATGERLDSYQIMDRVVAEAKAELGDVHELNRRQIIIPEGFDFTRQTDDAVGAMLAERNWTLDHLLQAAGWDFERAVFVKDMAKLKKEPLVQHGARPGADGVQQYHPTLFKYLPADVRRGDEPADRPVPRGRGDVADDVPRPRSPLEGRAAAAGTGDDDLPVKQMELPSPVVSRRDGRGDPRRTRCSASSCSTPPSRCPAGPRRCGRAWTRSRRAAEKAVHDGLPRPVRLRPGGVQAGHRPDPVAARPRGGPHTTCAGRGCATGARLIVQAGDIQEGHDICVPGGVRGRRRPPVPDAPARQGRAHLQARRDASRSTRLEAREALENLFEALEDTIKKVISKMGITTIEGYRGAHAVRGGRVRPGADGVPRRLPEPRRRHRPGRAGRGRPVAGRSRPRR